MKQLILSQTEDEKRKLVQRAFRKGEVLENYFFIYSKDPEKIYSLKGSQTFSIWRMVSDPDWLAFCRSDCYDYFQTIAGGKNED